MITKLKTIKKLREQHKLTQVQIAKVLKMARSSYIAIEKGGRDLSLQEAGKLSQALGVTVEELYENATPNYPKYRQMVLQFLRLVGGDGKLPKTKLAKYMYLSDFAWFYENLESMSGMAYRKIKYGPVPDQFFRALDELEEEGLITVDRKSREGREMFLIVASDAGKKKELKNLDKNEIQLMKRIEKKWRDKSTAEIVAFTHEQLPCSLSFDGEIISYSLITQEESKYVY